LLLKFPLLGLCVQKGLAQHICVVAESFVEVVNSLNMLLLLFVKVAIVQGLLLKVVDLSLQIPNLFVLFNFKLFKVDFLLELVQLAHHHAHMPTVCI